MSGSASERVAVVIASARSLPALMYSNRQGRVGEEDLHLPTEQIGERGCYAAIGHVHHVDAGHHLEQFGGDVGDAADAARTVGELARIGLGIGDELGKRLGRNRWMDHHDKGAADEARDRRDVANEIEIELVVKRRIDRVRRTDQEERVAVRRRTHDRLGGDIAAGARPVLDDEWLAEPLRQPLTDQAREDVVRAAGGKADDDAHRPRRIGLRPSETRHGRERGSARCQMQKLTARKFHGVLLWSRTCETHGLRSPAIPRALARRR